MANPTVFFPDKGEYVIKIGQSMTVNWSSTNVDEVNIFFLKNCLDPTMTEKILLARYPSYNGKNSFTFTINDSMYSEQYFSCKICVENSESENITEYSEIFKILKDG